jgi:hypothetical protein
MASPEQDNSRTAGRRPLRLIALASLMPPVLAVLVAVLAGWWSKESLTAGRAGVVAGLCALGLSFAVPVLVAARKRGLKTVLAVAAIGLALNAAIALIALAAYAQAQAEQQRQELQEEQERRTRDFLAHPGWLGTAMVSGALVTVVSWDDESLTAQDWDALFEASISILIIRVDNREGEELLTVDPSAVRLRLADGSTQDALPTTDVLETATEHKELLRKTYAGPYHVPAGKQLLDGVVFLPHGLDMAKVRSVYVRINGEDKRIEGAYLTAENKSSLYQQALEQTQRSAPLQPRRHHER